MFGVCLRYANNSTDAEDNLQEGFIKVFKYISKFRHEGSFEGWVRRIMVNVSIGRYRKKLLMYPVEDVEIYEMPNYSDDILDRISAQELIDLIQELTPRYRMVFNLYVLEGMKHKEISEMMNISVGTSKSNLARAREVLQRKVIDLYSEIKTNANNIA
ncbi:MAG: sigma-70 family RNA polymerase sigma factor [Draconibacterium sp.]|nr:sigma-70 family RNA polymerase sigma factor [Draconibacterium sp.]